MTVLENSIKSTSFCRFNVPVLLRLTFAANMDSNLVKETAKPWVALLDSLQTIGIDEELPIPQIVVFGDQSSGKSSLLESISGIPFPKGTGLVTRCPTRISLSTCESTEVWSAEVKIPGSFPESEEFNSVGRITSVDALSKRLSTAASIVCPKNANEFSTEVIQVQVQSPTMPNLSLIDLPGIIRTTTAGQDRSVIANVDQLLEGYLRQPETVILAVIPANQDIATIDILERATIYDPAGVRTIGVLTKPDLIDKGAEEEVLKIVQNIRKPLKLGYVIVKNRSQYELKNSVTLAQSQKNEDSYFSQHEVWQKIVPTSRGIKPLCEKLTNIIVSRAMDRGPTLKWYLLDKLNKTETKLTELGIEIPDSEVAKSKTLIKLVSRYCATLRQIAVGDYRDQLAQNNTELRIRFHVTQILDELRHTLSESVPDLSNEEYSDRLHAGISEMRGRELPGFGHTRLLLSTVADELEAWQLQVDEAISQAFNAYTSTANALAMKMAQQIPQLYEEILSTLHLTCDLQAIEVGRRVDEMFIRCTESASTDQDLIDSINVIRFTRFETAMKEVFTAAKDAESSKQTKAELKAHVLEMLGGFYMHYHSIGFGPNVQLEDAQAALKAYWRICEKRINEDVESAVDMMLLQRCSELVESTLLSKVQEWLADPDRLRAMMSEDPKVTEERAHLKTVRTNIKAALEKLDVIIPGCIPKSPFTL